MAKETEFNVNGKVVDYGNIQKVTIGDMEDLEERGISVNEMQQGNFSVKMAIDFIELFAHRVNDDVDRNDVRMLGINELQAHSDAIADRINQGQEFQGSPSS